MKKLLFSLAITSLVVSCQNDSTSTDSTTNPATNPILPVKITETGHITKFTYNGNHIYQEIDDNTLFATYTYTGDLITEINYVDGYKESYYYDTSGRLTQATVYNSGVLESTTNISYPTAATAKVVEVYNGIGLTKTKTSIYNLNADGSRKNGTITEVQTISGTTETGTGTFTATYDDKNYVFLNVAGMSKLSIYRDYPGCKNNMLTEKSIVTWPNGNSWTIEKFTYQYNASNFPIQSVTTSYDANGTTVTGTSTTIFEYNQ